MSVVFTVVALLPYYLLGVFPTGVLVARFYGVNITSVGSGNVGATNVSRVIGKKAGIVTLLGDVAKGALAIVIATICSSVGWFVAAAGVAVVAGHCLSLPPRLKGGKGVATALGVLVVLLPLSGLVAVATFAAVFSLSKLVSLSSILAALVVPAAALILNAPDSTIIAEAIIAAIVICRHRANIGRLIEGREPRFAFKKGE